MSLNLTTVTCALIESEGKILIARRAADQKLAGKWEFPGGKVEDKESPEECLKRELEEEFGIQVEVGEFIASNTNHYSPWGRILPFNLIGETVGETLGSGSSF